MGLPYWVVHRPQWAIQWIKLCMSCHNRYHHLITTKNDRSKHHLMHWLVLSDFILVSTVRQINSRNKLAYALPVPIPNFLTSAGLSPSYGTEKLSRYITPHNWVDNWIQFFMARYWGGVVIQCTKNVDAYRSFQWTSPCEQTRIKQCLQCLDSVQPDHESNSSKNMCYICYSEMISVFHVSHWERNWKKIVLTLHQAEDLKFFKKSDVEKSPA